MQAGYKIHARPETFRQDAKLGLERSTDRNLTSAGGTQRGPSRRQAVRHVGLVVIRRRPTGMLAAVRSPSASSIKEAFLARRAVFTRSDSRRLSVVGFSRTRGCAPDCRHA